MYQKDDHMWKQIRENNKINYKVEEELGIELIGDTKVKILVDENMDDWEEIVDTKDAMDAIEKSVNEDYLEKKQHEICYFFSIIQFQF